MTPHPLTMEYLRLFSTRPGMFIQDFDLRALENQLYGFDAALEAVGVMGQFARFNRVFSDFLLSHATLCCVQGWAKELHEKFGQSEAGLKEFLSLLEAAKLQSQH